MSHIHATVTIDTPVEKVLELVETPDNLAKCAPTVDRVVGGAPERAARG